MQPREPRNGWIDGGRNALILGLTLTALAALVVWFLPYEKVRALLDSAGGGRPGNGIETLPTEHGIRALIGRLPYAACFLAACAIALALLKNKLKGFAGAICVEWPEVRGALRRSFPAGMETRQEIGGVLVVFGAGLFLRLWHIRRGIHYDEAATYLFFASQPLYRALSNYSYPNNHLLHTLLVHLSLRTFGDTTVALRLPALIAGSLCVPMSWLTGRVLHNRVTGVLSAGCVAGLPTFIEYSVNARGYAQQWVFILAMMMCAAVLTSSPALKTPWLGFVLAGIGGLYSIPTMVVPMGGIMIWMVLSTAMASGKHELKRLLKRLAVAGVAIGMIGALLYLPPLLVSGPGAVLSNRNVVSRDAPFFEGLGSLAQATWLRWSEGVPAAILWILIGGVLAGLIFHRKTSVYAVPMTLVLWVWTFAFAWARNIVGFPRVWNYLLLAGIITASAGLSLLIRLAGGASQSRQVRLAWAASLLLASIVGTSLVRQRLLFRNNETIAMIDTPEVVDFLRRELRAGDCLVVNSPATPMIEYELRHSAPKILASLGTVNSANRVIAVLPKAEVGCESCRTDELLARLAAEDAVDPSLAGVQVDLSPFGPPQLLARFVSVTVYSFERKAKERQ